MLGRWTVSFKRDRIWGVLHFSIKGFRTGFTTGLVHEDILFPTFFLLLIARVLLPGFAEANWGVRLLVSPRSANSDIDMSWYPRLATPLIVYPQTNRCQTLIRPAINMQRRYSHDHASCPMTSNSTIPFSLVTGRQIDECRHDRCWDSTCRRWGWN